MKFVVYVLIGMGVVLYLLMSDSDFREAAAYTNFIATISSIFGTIICIMIWPLIVACRFFSFLRDMFVEKK